MNFNIVHDDYYDGLLKRLNALVPDFSFDDGDPSYMILFEFSQYVIENSNDGAVMRSYGAFINDVIKNGKQETEDAIVLQVFQLFYDRKVNVEIGKSYLSTEALLIYERSYIEYLKDHDQCDE